MHAALNTRVGTEQLAALQRNIQRLSLQHSELLQEQESIIVLMERSIEKRDNISMKVRGHLTLPDTVLLLVGAHRTLQAAGHFLSHLHHAPNLPTRNRIFTSVGHFHEGAKGQLSSLCRLKG